MERKQLKEIADLLHLHYPANIKSDKLKDQINAKLSSINILLKEEVVEKPVGVFRGYHPITGKPV